MLQVLARNSEMRADRRASYSRLHVQRKPVAAAKRRSAAKTTPIGGSGSCHCKRQS